MTCRLTLIEMLIFGQVVQGLGGYEGRHMERRENNLQYPESKYDNLRKGCPGE